MEIYNSNQTEKYKEFEKLLNNQSSKLKIEEGKITEGKISKITEKYVFLFIENLKSEPVLDINELKSIGLYNEQLKIFKETHPFKIAYLGDYLVLIGFSSTLGGYAIYNDPLFYFGVLSAVIGVVLPFILLVIVSV